jgi:hypothetical protein
MDWLRALRLCRDMPLVVYSHVGLGSRAGVKLTDVVSPVSSSTVKSEVGLFVFHYLFVAMEELLAVPFVCSDIFFPIFLGTGN